MTAPVLGPQAADCAVCKVLPQVQPKDCESRINIGLFFDGTNNNLHRDKKPNAGHTNVARLFEAYRNEIDANYYPIYIPGVGTPFPEIGETSESSTGNGFGWGGDNRILFGLMHVFNAVHRSFGNSNKNLAKGTFLFTPNHVMPICGKSFISVKELRAVQDMTSPVNLSSYDSRFRIIRSQLGPLTDLIKHPKTFPKPVEIMIDVFGFSRGAAEARAFANKLFELCSGNKLFGVPMQLRFLGLFDTVASVDFPMSINLSGHYEWAHVDDLKIDKRVKNWRHFVGLLEARASFPLDSARDGNSYPPNGAEIVYPGVHSDIGGGYAMGEQGRAMEYKAGQWYPNDKFKFSQVPLNDMFIAAKNAMVPWMSFDSKQAENVGLAESFAIDPSVRAALDNYFSYCGVAQKLPIEEMTELHQLQYLTWRYQVREGFVKLPGTVRAPHNSARGSGKEDLIEGNEILKLQILRLEDNSIMKWWNSSKTGSWGALAETIFRSPNAKKILKEVKKRRAPVHSVIINFFDQYVHDSYAGFKPIPGGGREPQGYFHRRVVFAGNETILTAQLEQKKPTSNEILTAEVEQKNSGNNGNQSAAV